MQFTSTPKRTATRCLIAALAVLVLWFLGPVLLAGVRRVQGSKLYQGEAPS